MCLSNARLNITQGIVTGFFFVNSTHPLQQGPYSCLNLPGLFQLKSCVHLVNWYLGLLDVDGIEST